MIVQQEKYDFEHVVCGGGLVGAIWALYLRRRSTSVALFESYYDLRQQLIVGGRSINLVLSRKALSAIQQLGIKEQIIKNTIPIKGQAIHCQNGDIFKLLYGLNENQTNFCVARNKLNQSLLDIVQNNNIPIFFQYTLAEGDVDSNQYIFKTRNNFDEEIDVKVKAKHFYGTDGAGSKTRQLLLTKIKQQTIIDWYPTEQKEMFLPFDQNKDYIFDPNWVHLWPRGGQLMMGHANDNKSFSMTLILPSNGQNSFSSIDSQDGAENYFSTKYKDLADKIPNTFSQLSQNPIGNLGTIKVSSWYYKDKVVLLDDSAHTIAPFLWQAVNVGLDDCFYLDKMVNQYGFTEKAFEQYFKLQKPKADAIAEMTLNNFEPLATFSNQQEFINLKKIQKQVQRVCPNRFWSKYRMVFFGDMPYNQISQLIPKYQSFLLKSKDRLSNPEQRQLFLVEEQLKKFSI